MSSKRYQKSKENSSLRLIPHREGAKTGFHIHMYYSLIIPAYRKHQHREYTYKTVQSVYTATKLTMCVLFPNKLPKF